MDDLTIQLEVRPNGWIVCVFSGDKTVPGSLLFASGAHESADAALEAVPAFYRCDEKKLERCSDCWCEIQEVHRHGRSFFTAHAPKVVAS